MAAEKKLPVIAFVEDVAASGGYMIACAADEIVCDPSSIVGSIGVVGGAFGFQEAIKKLGIERRIYTAGEHKVMLDPFQPEEPGDVARLKALRREIHAIFIALVKGSRGARLKGSEDVLFTGEYWAGETAWCAGPCELGRRYQVHLRERFGDKVLTPVDRFVKRGMLAGLLGRRSPGRVRWQGLMVSGVAGGSSFPRWIPGRSGAGLGSYQAFYGFCMNQNRALDLVLTRFLDANRCPPRFKSGFGCETRWQINN